MSDDSTQQSTPNGVLNWTDRKTGERKRAQVEVTWHYPPRREGDDHEVGSTSMVEEVEVLEDPHQYRLSWQRRPGERVRHAHRDGLEGTRRETARLEEHFGARVLIERRLVGDWEVFDA